MYNNLVYIPNMADKLASLYYMVFLKTYNKFENR